MSGDTSGESLEAILASIRRSLAEQATTALESEADLPTALPPESDPPADLDAPPIPGSVSQQLAATLDAVQGTSADVSAGAAAEASPGAEAAPAFEAPPAAANTPRAPALVVVASAPEPTAPDQIAVPGPIAAGSAPTGEPVATSIPSQSASAAPAAPPAAELPVESAPAPAATEPARKPADEPASGKADPLWFLSQGAARTAAPPAGPPQSAAPPTPAAEPRPARPPEPKPSPLTVGRGPLAPFFGSPVAEVVKVEMVPDRSVRSSVGVPPPLPASPEVPGVAHPFETPRSNGGGEALRGLHTPPMTDAAGAMRAASSVFGPPPAEARPGPAGEAHSPQLQALEAMVAELLRPMLRRWLDENMPRLVSAALQAELMARRDPKKP